MDLYSIRDLKHRHLNSILKSADKITNLTQREKVHEFVKDISQLKTNV